MYYVYILKCNDNTLYTGYTNDLCKRENAHNAGIAAKYTRVRLPVSIVYSEEYATRSDAMKREAAIKKLTRSEKLALIEKESENSLPK